MAPMAATSARVKVPKASSEDTLKSRQSRSCAPVLSKDPRDSGVREIPKSETVSA